MTFFIVLFIVLMQFLWKYIDDLVGKGLSMDVLGELFFYAAVSMVPMALPLAILLASLMTFGNFGEKFELTAMKASGISLIQVMKPLIVLISFVAVGAFFFQNDVLPKAQVKMWTLLFSVRQKSPEVEIPEGVFYDQIPGYNLFVQSKNRETGMLYDVMIYANSDGSGNTTILTSDSARMALTKDNKYLYLHLYQGEQFENLREQQSTDNNVPFRRETYFDKQVMIPFDANFNRMDEGGMRRQYVGKNIAELNQTIDSINVRLDSLGGVYEGNLRREAFPIMVLPEKTTVASTTPPPAPGIPQSSNSSLLISNSSLKKMPPLSIDSVLSTLPTARQNEIFSAAHNLVSRHRGEVEFRALDVSAEKKNVRRHKIELLKKFTLSVACLIFFFIGAPLGAIIRKGGLGTPLVISVLLFLFYYIIDNTGYKMARDGHAQVWLGMWISTFILAPLSVYVTIKAMNDSAVFDKDRYIAIFRKILGIRPARSVAYKEVIINDVDPAVAWTTIERMAWNARRLLRRTPLKISYWNYFLHGIDTRRLRALSEEIDEAVEYMSDWRDLKVIDLMGMLPPIGYRWIYDPAAGHRWLAWVFIILFPIGIPLYLVGLHARRKLRAELRQTMNISGRIMEGILQ